MKAAVLRTILITFLCNPNFISSASTGIDGNISSSKTNPDMSNKVEEALEDDYNSSMNILEPSININDDMVRDNLHNPAAMDSPNENSEESKNVSSNDSPVILTLSESSSIDIDSLVDTPLVVSTRTSDKSLLENSSDPNGENVAVNKTNITQFARSINPENDTLIPEDLLLSNINKNTTGEQNEEIPSFSEWAQKRLEEAEKSEQINSSVKGQAVNGKSTTAKLRWKNYASLDCGAKVIAANPESVSPGAVLSPSSDEYKLNTCTSRIWFVVELCEAIQTRKIDLANYELFSSSPKDFVVYVSDRYPTRDWSVAGKFTAKDERDIQSFDLDTHIFGKYIKVEIKSHYGSEHYCPISLFRAYGTSVFEVLQKEDPGNVNPTDEDDDDDDDQILSLKDEHDDSQKNLFSSATDAVISIVKRAAEALGNKVNNRTAQEKNGTSDMSSLADSCSTPSHVVLCKNCSDMLFQEIYKTISCDSSHIKKFVSLPLVFNAFTDSWICQSFGYEYNSIDDSSSYMNSFTNYVTSFFPFKYINAICREISILENTVNLNITHHFTNATGNITTEQIVNLKVQQPHVSNPEDNEIKLEQMNQTKSLNLSPFLIHSESKSNLEENLTYASQIKPTKTLTPEVQISQTDVISDGNASSEYVESSEKIFIPDSSESISSENYVDGTADNSTEIEGMDTLDEHLENFISDLNTDNSQNIPVSTTSTSTTPQAQKESVFLRLSNRIKVLERNMSLSSQYLEELSRRYKKQVEEMQHLLEKTIVALREEAQRKDLRNKELEDRLDNLTIMMESLVAERHNWVFSMYCLVTGILILIGIYFFCRKSTTYIDPPRENKETTEVLRRKSIDVVTHCAPVKKKRRPSDQALKIVRCSTANSEVDKHKPTNQRQRKRKKKHLIRSNSIDNIKLGNRVTESVQSDGERSPDWVERNHQLIEDIPFALEESDNTALEAYPLENDLISLNSSKEPILPDSKSNGNSSHNHESHNVSQEISNHTDKNSLQNTVSNGTESMKKEKRSFKKLLKKVF